MMGLQFLSLSVVLLLKSCASVCLTRPSDFSSFLENRFTLFRYINANIHLQVDSATSNVLWNVLCAIFNPMGMRINRHNSGWNGNAVLLQSRFSIFIRAYPLFVSEIENTVASFIELIQWFRRELGHRFHFGQWFLDSSLPSIVRCCIHLERRQWVNLI